MKVLLGTDVLLYYLQKQELVDGIDLMLQWMERIKAVAYTDISSVAVLTNFVSLNAFGDLRRLEILDGIRPKASEIENLELKDSMLPTFAFEYKPLLAQLNWLFYDDIDYLVTENPMSHKLAKRLEVDDKVFTIENFLEKCNAEHRDLDEMYGVAIQKVPFGSLDYDDRFFNTFKAEYEPYYHKWFKKKANDDIYIATDRNGRLKGLLKLKIEGITDDPGLISPVFKPAKRLKICSLKADFTSQKLGQRFMRVVFYTAVKENVDEIYITLFPDSTQRRRLVGMIEQWGFEYYGTKDLKEQVYVKSFSKSVYCSPKKSFPYCSLCNSAYLLPINRNYASVLLPPFGIEENRMDVEPVKQAIKKVLILQEDDSIISRGSILLFVQRAEDKKQVELISLGVVDNIYRHFQDEEQFIRRCRKRSCLSNNTLHNFWVGSLGNPIVVDFLYSYHFEKALEPEKIVSLGLEVQKMPPQCPLPLSKEQFRELIKSTPYEKIVIVDPS